MFESSPIPFRSIYSTFTSIFYRLFFPPLRRPSPSIPSPRPTTLLSPKTFSRRGTSSLITAIASLSRTYVTNGTPSLDPLSTSSAFSPFYPFTATFLGAVIVVAFPCPARASGETRLESPGPTTVRASEGRREVVLLMNERGKRRFMEER